MASLGQQDREGKALGPCFVIFSPTNCSCIFSLSNTELSSADLLFGVDNPITTNPVYNYSLGRTILSRPRVLAAPLFLGTGAWPSVRALIDRAYPVYWESAEGPHQILPSLPSVNGSL